MNRPIKLPFPNPFLQYRIWHIAWHPKWYILCIISCIASTASYSQVAYIGLFDNAYQGNNNGFNFTILNATVFPDTTVQAVYGDGNGGTVLANVYLHGTGEVFDPKSQMYDHHISKYNPYTVDTVSIAYKYNYVYEAGAAPDTLIFQFYAGCRVDIDSGTFKANASSPFYKEVYAYPLYDHINNRGFNEVSEYKYILGSNDATGSTFNFISVPTNGSTGIHVNANDLFAYTVSYRPGFSYQPGDTIDELWTQTPTNLHSHFRALVAQSKSKGNDGYEESLSITQNRYNNMPGWNGRYIPGNAWNGYDEILWSEFHTIVQNVQNDAGLDYFVAPEPLIFNNHYCANSQIPVKVILSNYQGYADLTSALISWSINGTRQSDFQWNGTLPQNATDTVLLGAGRFTAGENTIKAWVSSPNGALDSLPQNDTISMTFYVNPKPNASFTVSDISAQIKLFTPVDHNLPHYLWNFGDGQSSNALTPSHNYVHDSTYRPLLSVTDDKGCSSIHDTTITIADVSIKNTTHQDVQLTVYPNPCTDAITIEYELTRHSSLKIELYDAFGTRINIVDEATAVPGTYQTNINLEKYHLAHGIYLLKCSNGNTSVSERILKL